MSSSTELELFNKRKALIASVSVSTGGLGGWSAEIHNAGDSWLRLRLRLCAQQPDVETTIALLMASSAVDEVDRQLQRLRCSEATVAAQPTPSSEATVAAQPTPPTPPLSRAVALRKGARFDSLDMASLPSSSLLTPSVDEASGSESSSDSEEELPESGSADPINVELAPEQIVSAAPVRIPSVLRSGAGRRSSRVQQHNTRGKLVFRSKRSSTIQLANEVRVTPFILTRGEARSKQEYVRWIQRLRQEEQEALANGRPAAGDDWSDSDDEFSDAPTQATQQLHNIERRYKKDTSSEEDVSSEDGATPSAPESKDSASSASDDDGGGGGVVVVHRRGSHSSESDDQWSD